MADRAKFLAAKRRLRKFLRKIIAESEQIARDIAWWNEHRTDVPPFDRGGDLVVVNLAKELLLRVEAEQPIPGEMWIRFREQLEANAKG